MLSPTQEQVIKFKPSFARHINTLCLPGSRACQMACKYCYAGYSTFQRSPEPGVSRELIEKSLSFLVDYLRPYYPPALVIGFGGDPIEAWDYYLYAHELTKTVEKYSKVTIMMSSTHGQTLAPKHVDFIKKIGGGLSFSIDGTRENYAKVRSGRNKNVDPYERVLESYKMAKDEVFTSVNCTVTPEGSLVHDLQHVYDLGFRTITMLPVRPTEASQIKYSPALDDGLKRQYAELIEYLKVCSEQRLTDLLTALTPEDYFSKNLYRIVLNKNYHRKCGAAFNFVYVSGDGTITPCASFRTSNNVNYNLGHIDTGFDYDKLAPIFSFSTHKQEPCKSCEVESVCGGYCFFNAYQTNKDVNTPYSGDCDLAIFLIKELWKFHEFLVQHRPNALLTYKDKILSAIAFDDAYFKGTQAT